MSNVYIDEEQSNKCSSFADKLPNTIMINVNFSQTVNITKKEIKFAGKIKIKLYPSTLTQDDLCSSLLLLLHPPSYGCLHRIPTGDQRSGDDLQFGVAYYIFVEGNEDSCFVILSMLSPSNTLESQKETSDKPSKSCQSIFKHSR